MKAKQLPIIVALSLVSGAQAWSEFDRGSRMDWWREARFGMFVH
jgi:hypothetical protein